MTKTKKLTLFLLPLVPLTAIGIVEVASAITVPGSKPNHPTCVLPPPIAPTRVEPAPAPAPVPQPAPVA